MTAGWVDIVESEIRFWNGSKIYLCHCEHEKHRFKYQGAEMHVLLIDELTTFTEVIYKFLRTRVRMTSIGVPSDLAGRFPRILCSSNPGNIGHGWVKRTFITGRQPMLVERMGESEGGMLRQFIPALMEDNPTLERDDPTYRARIKGLGSAALVRAFEKGDWDAVAGSFLEGVWDADKHIVKPFPIPSNWKTWRSLDWGYSKPYSVLWHALNPDGVHYVWRELYGWGEKENVGSREEVSEVAKKIQRIQEHDARLGYEYRTNPADPSIFAKVGHEHSVAGLFRKNKVIWQPADAGARSRVNGAQQVIELLQSDRLFVFESCRHLIRTMPALMPDENNPEDVNTKMEDHAWDALRYGLMRVRRSPDEQQISVDPEEGTYKHSDDTFRLKV